VAGQLTAAAVAKLRAAKEARQVLDGGVPGLYLQVQPSGHKSWIMRFRRPSGVQAKLTLGRADVSSSREPPRRAQDRRPAYPRRGAPARGGGKPPAGPGPRRRRRRQARQDRAQDHRREHVRALRGGLRRAARQAPHADVEGEGAAARAARRRLGYPQRTG
jgi:hypothetical protein